MKLRERVVAALRGKTPDRVPLVEYLFSPRLQQELLGGTTPLYDGPSQLALAHQLGLDGMWIPSTDHSLHDGIPLQNILAYVGVGHEYGKYPLRLPGASAGNRE